MAGTASRLKERKQEVSLALIYNFIYKFSKISRNFNILFLKTYKFSNCINDKITCNIKNLEQTE